MAAVLESWEANARQWIETVEGGDLEIRKLATNAAVVQAVRRLHPARVLDAGCGEGWLCRELQKFSMETVGVDGVAELIHEARIKGNGHYELLPFEELVNLSNWPPEYFDVVVFNFSLYELELTKLLLQAASHWVLPCGKLVLQTQHPFCAIEDGHPYKDGWIVEKWTGFPRQIFLPYKWYFRTMAGWCETIESAGWRMQRMEEPVNPKDGKPVSLLITAQKGLDARR